MEDKIMPFGKYKGLPVESLASDKKYTEWLLRQIWFKEEHIELYNIVTNNFREALNTPEFSAIQNKFLKPEYRVKLAYSVNQDLFCQNSEKINAAMHVILNTTEGGKNMHFLKALANPVVEDEFGLYTKELLKLSKPVFDTIDAYYTIWYGLQFYYDNENFYGGWSLFKQEICTAYRVDIKPVISDNLAIVLRQLKASMPVEKNEHLLDKFYILLVGNYIGTEATREEFIDFFGAQGYKVVFANEVDLVKLPEFDREFKPDPIVEKSIKQNN